LATIDRDDHQRQQGHERRQDEHPDLTANGKAGESEKFFEPSRSDNLCLTKYSCLDEKSYCNLRGFKAPPNLALRNRSVLSQAENGVRLTLMPDR
jgi:hypothetical protein